VIIQNQRICLGIDDIVTRGILNPDGPVPQVKMCSSLESELYLPPEGNGGMQRDYLCSAQGFSRGKKKHNEQHGEEICAQMRMWKNLDEERETISFRKAVVKLVLPQQSESSRELASGWL